LIAGWKNDFGWDGIVFKKVFLLVDMGEDVGLGECDGEGGSRRASSSDLTDTVALT